MPKMPMLCKISGPEQIFAAFLKLWDTGKLFGKNYYLHHMVKERGSMKF